jgi:23S rRNA (uracil1939-C5)-methyltransferase
MPPFAMAGNHDVTADELDEAGAGVGRVAAGGAGAGTGAGTGAATGAGSGAGMIMHVADLLPGERARVALEHTSPHRGEAWGRVVERLGPVSGARVAPACPAWGRCGGCGWQHLAYDAQLAEKRRLVERALAGLDVEVGPVLAAPATTGYRNKGKYVVGRGRAGRVVLGAWAPRSHALVDTGGCRVVMPLVDELRGCIAAAAGARGLEPYDERRRTGWLRYAIVRVTRGGHALIVLVVRSDAPAGLVQAVAEDVAGDARVAGVVRVDNDRDDGGLLDGAGRALVGADHVEEVVAGVPVALGAVEFAQVNPAQADALYARVASLAGVGPGDRAADVYAGVGGFGFAMARAGATVYAIEREPAAVEALARAAAAAGLADRLHARAGDASTLAALPGPLAAIVIDPPRKGCSPAVLAALAAAPAARLVYVSCGPASLARDLRALLAAGWETETIEPIDLMPGTAQVEVIAPLRRKQAPGGAAG